VPYPFQLNLHRLPEADRGACLAGLVTRPSANEKGILSYIVSPMKQKPGSCPRMQPSSVLPLRPAPPM